MTSFGKLSIKPDRVEAFLADCEKQGLKAHHVRGTIYDLQPATILASDSEHLKKVVGLIGLHYSDFGEETA